MSFQSASLTPVALAQPIEPKMLDLGVSQNYGYPFGDPYIKDYSILGSMLGSAYFGKLPF